MKTKLKFFFSIFVVFLMLMVSVPSVLAYAGTNELKLTSSYRTGYVTIDPDHNARISYTPNQKEIKTMEIYRSGPANLTPLKKNALAVFAWSNNGGKTWNPFGGTLYFGNIGNKATMVLNSGSSAISYKVIVNPITYATMIIKVRVY